VNYYTGRAGGFESEPWLRDHARWWVRDTIGPTDDLGNYDWYLNLTHICREELLWRREFLPRVIEYRTYMYETHIAPVSY